MANLHLKRINIYNPSNWRRGRFHILSENKFQEILDRERERVDRSNGFFSLVSFNVQKKEGSKNISQEIINVLKSRQLRRIDDIGWCCSSHISILLHSTGANGARCFAKDIIGLLVKRNQDIEYTVCTYPNDFKSRNGDKRSTKGFRTNDIPEDFQKISEENFDKYVEDETPGLSNITTLESLRVCSRKVLKFNGLLTIKISVWKRFFDIVGSALLILLFSPAMLATAVAIKLTSKGPIIFKQQRAGISGEPFTFYKFRSMVVDAERKKQELLQHNIRSGPVFKMDNDPRITRVGRFIRKWSLDESLQFFNVLKGDMSLVGPRPPTMDEVAEYFNWHDRRLDIKPGITCIWQVYARHNKCFEEWVRLDIEYARSQSFLLDLKILFLTLPAVFSRRGAQ